MPVPQCRTQPSGGLMATPGPAEPTEGEASRVSVVGCRVRESESDGVKSAHGQRAERSNATSPSPVRSARFPLAPGGPLSYLKSGRRHVARRRAVARDSDGLTRCQSRLKGMTPRCRRLLQPCQQHEQPGHRGNEQDGEQDRGAHVVGEHVIHVPPGNPCMSKPAGIPARCGPGHACPTRSGPAQRRGTSFGARGSVRATLRKQLWILPCLVTS